MENNIKVGQPPELCDMNRFVLLPNPAFAEAHAEGVHSVVPISVNKVHRVSVGETMVINIGDGSRHPHAVHTPHLYAWREEITGEALGVIPHVPGSKRINDRTQKDIGFPTNTALLFMVILNL